MTRAKIAYDKELESFQKRGMRLREDIEKFSDRYDERLNDNLSVARAALGIVWKSLHTEIYRDCLVRQRAEQLGYIVIRNNK